MSELDKVLEWVENNTYRDNQDIERLDKDDLVDFIKGLQTPTKKFTWQCRTLKSNEWRNITDEEYELFQHLSRYFFQRVEVDA